MNMKIITAILCMALSACAYQGIGAKGEGDAKAALHVIAPNLEGMKLSNVDLDVYISAADEQCRWGFFRGGRLQLEPDRRSVSTSIPAGKFLELAISYRMHNIFAGASSAERVIAFVPEANKEYTLQVDTTGFDFLNRRFIVKFYEGSEFNESTTVPVFFKEDCKARMNVSGQGK